MKHQLSAFLSLVVCAGCSNSTATPTAAPSGGAKRAESTPANAQSKDAASSEPLLAALGLINQVSNPVAKERDQLLLLISRDYELNGQEVVHSHEPDRFQPFIKSADAEVVRLASMGAYSECVYLANVDSIQKGFDSVNRLFGVNSAGRTDFKTALATLGTSFEDRYDDMFEKVSQQYTSSLRLECIFDQLWNSGGALAKRWAGDGSFDPRDLEIQASGRWEVAMKNRSTHELHNVTLALEYKMKQFDGKNPALDRLIAAVAAELGGKTDMETVARRAARFHDNILAYHMLHLKPCHNFVHISSLPAGQEVKSALKNMPYQCVPDSAEYSLWGGSVSVENAPLPGFDQLLEKQAKRQQESQVKAPLELIKPGSSDLFAKGSVWKGGIIKIVVLERSDEDFTAEMFSGARRLRKIIGTIANGVIKWHGAPGEQLPGAENAGTINGDTIEVRYPLGKDKSKLEGFARLNYVSSKQ